MAKTVENLLFFTHKSSKTNIIESTKINPHFLLQIQDTRLRKIGPNPKTRKKKKTCLNSHITSLSATKDTKLKNKKNPQKRNRR